MKITLDQVESLRKRVECDYQTAEKVLRKTGGNEDQAVLFLLKRRDHKVQRLFRLMLELIRKVWNIHLTLGKKNKVVLRIPIVLIGVGYVFFNPPMGFLLALVLVAIAAGYEFELEHRGFSGYEKDEKNWGVVQDVVENEPARTRENPVHFGDSTVEGWDQKEQQIDPKMDPPIAECGEEPVDSWDEVHEIVIE